MPEGQDKTRLHRTWAAQLHREYAHFKWACGLKELRTPVIEVTTAASYLGRWRPDPGLIQISSRLIENHPWDAVRNILRHEMAHQVVTDIFRADDGHGPLYRKACDRLGVPHAYRRAGGPIPDEVLNNDIQAEKGPAGPLLDKVRKLLALARSDNENEAALAMKKSNELIARHNLNRPDPQQDRHVYRVIRTGRKRLSRTHLAVIGVLKDFYFVEVILADEYEPGAQAEFRTIELFGLAENVLTAEYVYHFLQNQMTRLWKSYAKTRSKAHRRDRKSYDLGLLAGFRRKLADQEAAFFESNPVAPQSGRTLALSLVEKDVQLARFIRARHPRLGSTRRNGPLVNRGAYRDGIDAGGRINIHRAMENNEGFKGRLLEED